MLLLPADAGQGEPEPQEIRTSGSQCLERTKQWNMCAVYVWSKDVYSESWDLGGPLRVQGKLRPREATGISC